VSSIGANVCDVSAVQEMYGFFQDEFEAMQLQVPRPASFSIGISTVMRYS
jgi:hypothetical protein